MIYTFSIVLVEPLHKLCLVNVEVHGSGMVNALASELTGLGSSPDWSGFEPSPGTLRCVHG